MSITSASFALKGRSYSIEYFIRKGGETTVLFVHGLGGSKENFWQASQCDWLKGFTLISFDNPGTGNSTYYEDLALDVDDLADLTRQFICRLGLKDFYLAGASMGGLITLLYLERNNTCRVKGYINIEGNFLPEDCMFSGKVVVHDYDTFKASIFQEAIDNMKRTGNPGYHIVANNLELNTNVRAYYDYSFQTVRYSSDGSLLKYYIAMAIPRIFIYGEANKALSYLTALNEAGMNQVMIPGSDHFIFYDNPKEMYRAISDFIFSTRDSDN